MGEMMRRASRLHDIKRELERLRLPEDMNDPRYDKVWDRRMELHAEISDEIRGMDEKDESNQ